MFEKEAEEWVLKNSGYSKNEFHGRKAMEAYKDGAEFGYKKGLKAKVKFTTVSDYPFKDQMQLQKELEEVTERLETQKEINKELVDQQEELKEKLSGAEKTRDRLKQLGFPTFQSCIEYTDKMNYAKAIIQNLLDNSNEYARERAINFLKGE